MVVLVAAVVLAGGPGGIGSLPILLPPRRMGHCPYCSLPRRAPRRAAAAGGGRGRRSTVPERVPRRGVGD